MQHRLNLTFLDYQNPRLPKRRLTRRWLILLCCLVFVGLAFAVFMPSVQHLNRSVYLELIVVITDAKTGQPVRDASVTFEGNEEGVRWTATTDASGVAKIVTEWTVVGTDAGPFYFSKRYSTNGVCLLISANGYIPTKATIADERAFKIMGFGTDPKFQIDIPLQALATTEPSRK